METLASTSMGDMGMTEIKSDTPSTQVKDGQASVMRFEPEGGKPSVFAAVQTPDEANGLYQLFQTLMTNGELRDSVESITGTGMDWSSLADRHQKAAGSFTTDQI